MEKTLDKAMDLLTALAARLGTSVEHLWPVLVRQAYYQGIVDLVIVGVLGPILVTVCVKAGRRALELGDKRDWS
ncbi:MAG: hypothetical protein ACREKK_02700, partial [Candidatus Methylomirabilales bacterium]